MSNVTSRGKSNRTDHLREFFIDRLQHMVTIRRERGPELDEGSTHLRLLDKAVYSTYCDCLDLGLGGEARAIIRSTDSVDTADIDPNPGKN